MLYEPPKTKKYILIGASAVALAVLVIVAAPLLYRNKANQLPVAKLSPQEKLQQDRIQKEMEEVAERLKDQKISEQKAEEDMNSASEEMRKLPVPPEEEMKKVSEELNQ